MPQQDEMPGEHTPGTAIAKAVDHAPAMARMGAAIMSDDEIRRSWRTAAALAQSKMFKDATQAEQAFAKILIGRDLGLGPTQALMSIDLVKGNLQLRSVLLASFVRKSLTYDYKVVEHDEQHCKIEFYRVVEPWTLASGAGPQAGRRELIGTSEFSIDDAKRAGIYPSDPRSAWQAHPRNMLIARAMSNGVRWYCPDLLGGIPVYTEADVFEGTAVDAGEGDGEPLGLDLGPEVEKVIARATELGHAGLSDRASIEVALGQQPPGYVADKVKEWNAELDAMERELIERQPVPDDLAERLRARGWHETEGGLWTAAGVGVPMTLAAAAKVLAAMERQPVADDDGQPAPAMQGDPDGPTTYDEARARRDEIRARLDEGADPDEFEALEAELQDVEAIIASEPIPGQEKML